MVITEAYLKTRDKGKTSIGINIKGTHVIVWKLKGTSSVYQRDHGVQFVVFSNGTVRFQVCRSGYGKEACTQSSKVIPLECTLPLRYHHECCCTF